MSHLFHRNFANQETPFSQLPTGLSAIESSGGMLDLGRRHQLPQDWPSPITRFLAPSAPKPPHHYPLRRQPR